MREQRVEQLKIYVGTNDYDIFEEACFKSRLLYNQANYWQRQEFFNSGRDFDVILDPWSLRNRFKNSEEYKALGGHLSAETVMMVGREWKGWKASWLSWNREYRAQIEKQGIKYKTSENGTIKLNQYGEPIVDKSTQSFKGESQQDYLDSFAKNYLI